MCCWCGGVSAFVCLLGVGWDGQVFEFTPVYLWDPESSCIGRWRAIPDDDMDMARITLRLAAKGLGAQDLWTTFPGTGAQLVCLIVCLFDCLFV